MRKRIFVFLLCTILMCLPGGCFILENNGLNNREQEKPVYTGEFTEEKIDFCERMFKTKHQDASTLAPGEVEMLMQYDVAMEYLHSKYPSCSFEFVALNRWEKLKTMEFTFTGWRDSEENKYPVYEITHDHVCIVRLRQKENASGGEVEYEIVDNFYGFFLYEDYADYITGLLAENGYSPIRVDVSFGALMGKDVDETYTLQNVLNGEYGETIGTDIYLNAPGMEEEEYEELEKSLKILLRENGINTLCCLRVSDDNTTEHIIHASIIATYE